MEHMAQLVNEVRYAVRVLRKSVGFSAAAMATLALGIGANTAIFSVLERVVLAPLPYRQPERLALVWLNNLTLKHYMAVSYPDFLDWQRNARSFDRMAAMRTQDRDLTAPGSAEHLKGQEVSSGFFRTLGIRPVLGREFTSEEDQRSGAPAAILSDGLWRARFGASKTVLGKSVMLDGVDYTIVGVLPPGFRFWTDSDVYTPIGQGDPLIMQDRTVHAMICVARLKAGITLDRAQAEIGSVEQHLNELYPASERGVGAVMFPLQQQLVGDLRGTLLLLMAAVGLVLLIACANVANLLLARSAVRGRELAIRAALGASRKRIARQLLTESLLLSVAGGTLGLGIAVAGVRVVLAQVPAGLGQAAGSGLNLPVLLFTLGVSILAGLLFGLAPALKSTEPDLDSALREGGRGSSGMTHRAQGMLVIGQVALTLVLLAGAGLLFQTIRHLWEINPGFDARQVITFHVGLSPQVTQTAESTRTALRQLLERIRRIPEVQAADFTTLVPLSPHDNAGPFWIGSQTPVSMAEAPRALYQEVGPDYLRVMRIPLLHGRFLNAEDTAQSSPVVVIDSVLARTYFPGQDPVGQTIHIAHWGAGRIVGVVGHVSHYGLGNAVPYTSNEIYISFYQLTDEWVRGFSREATILARTPRDAGSFLPAIKEAVSGAEGDEPVYDVQPLRDIVAGAMGQQRFPMILLGAFAGLALILASVGIYGVIAYAMAQRAREIGIRMALGATSGAVVRIALAHGLRLTAAGVALGVAAVIVLARTLPSFSGLLYEVEATDPLNLGVVAAVLMGAGILACYVPARRAAGGDPMTALRTN